MKSIATRVSFWALLIVGFGFSITAALVGESVYKNLVKEVHSRQFSLARLVASEIGQEINLRFNSLEGVARSLGPEVQSSDLQGLQKRLQSHITFNLLFDNETFVVDANGVAIASVSNDADRIGTNYSDREWWQTAQQTVWQMVRPRARRVWATAMACSGVGADSRFARTSGRASLWRPASLRNDAREARRAMVSGWCGP